MAARKPSYAWAENFGRGDPEYRWLSRAGQNGLVWAQELAENASARRHAALVKDVPPVRLTITSLGRGENFFSEREIRNAIKQTQIELFGQPLSERAIRYRLAKRKPGKPLPDPRRPCLEPGCTDQLAPDSASHKRYCTRHDTTRARVRRHRRHARANSTNPS